MKSNGLLASFFLVILLLLLPGSAVGQVQAPAADCTQDSGCLALKEQAANRSKSGDIVEALRLYKLAYEVRPDPRLLFNIARLLHKQEKTAEAVPYYQQFIDAPIQDAEQQKKAREYLVQIQSSQAAPAQKDVKQPSSNDTDLLPPNVVRTDPSTPGKPIYKKWWLWTLIGGVVIAGVAAGVAGGVVAARQQLSEPIVRPFGS